MNQANMFGAVNHYNPHATDDQEEFLYHVTPDDEVIGLVTRRECHNETTKPWHRAMHVYLFDKDGNLYLSQRSLTKDMGAGKWIISASGHITYGQEYEEVALREVEEELQLKPTQVEFLGKLAIDLGSEREVIGIFAGVVHGEPKVDPMEVAQAKLFDFEDIVAQFESGKFELAGGSPYTFKHILDNGTLRAYRNRILNRSLPTEGFLELTEEEN